MFSFTRWRAACRLGMVPAALPEPMLRPLRARTVILLAAAGIMQAGCASSSRWTSGGGVSASPRVMTSGPVPKGGGVYKVGNPYQIGGTWYVPKVDPTYNRVGTASWYGDDFHGRRTANGEIYDMHALTAAHPTMPLPSYAYVTNRENGRTLLVRVNDRGPYVAGRIIDLSKASAELLGLHHKGTGEVRVRYAGPAPLNGNDARERRFLASQEWHGSTRLAANRAPAPRALPSAWPRAYMSGTWTAKAYRSLLARK